MRNDSSFGIQNFPQTVAVTTEVALLAPSASGVYPSIPSPTFPLSTTTYPTGVFIGVPPDIAGSVFDGHPFEVVLAAVITSSATTNCLIDLYNAKATTFAGGPAASSYTLATLGTGCTKVVTGTATAGLTASQSINYLLKAQFIWDNTTKILAYTLATQYLNGASVAVAASSNATSVTLTDLNFIPSFTFASAATTSIVVKEFVINRV